MSSVAVSYPSSGVSAASSIEQTVSVTRLNGPHQKFIVKFAAIKYERSVFDLFSPIELLLSPIDGGAWCCEEDRVGEKLGIYAFGDTKEKAVCSFFEDFAVLWDEIAVAEGNTLSADALRTKRIFLSTVKSLTVS